MSKATGALLLFSVTIKIKVSKGVAALVPLHCASASAVLPEFQPAIPTRSCSLALLLLADRSRLSDRSPGAGTWQIQSFLLLGLYLHPRSLELLYSLGALDSQGKLTSPVGTSLSRLPVDPMYGKVLLAATGMGCSIEAMQVGCVRGREIGEGFGHVGARQVESKRKA
eukprot:1160003-Pelagomonas_calceolata.AAC.5